MGVEYRMHREHETARRTQDGWEHRVPIQVQRTANHSFSPLVDNYAIFLRRGDQYNTSKSEVQWESDAVHECAHIGRNVSAFPFITCKYRACNLNNPIE